MSAILALPVDPPRVASVPELRRELLTDVREAARRCQAKPRIELFQACAMLSDDRNRSRSAFRNALLRTLSEGLDHRPVFYRPDSTDLSFDERWLLALIDAVDRDDRASQAFLAASRLRAHTRRQVLFLVAGLVGTVEIA